MQIRTNKQKHKELCFSVGSQIEANNCRRFSIYGNLMVKLIGQFIAKQFE